MNAEITRNIIACAQKYKGLRLFVLFGSRAHGISREESDWDFGYIGNSSFDPSPLSTDLMLTLEANKVDLVDLTRASGLLRFRVARDGQLLFEAPKGEYQKFWLTSVNFWCEVSPILQEEYNSLLKRLG